jgi:hypothetical protein
MWVQESLSDIAVMATLADATRGRGYKVRRCLRTSQPVFGRWGHSVCIYKLRK